MLAANQLETQFTAINVKKKFQQQQLLHKHAPF